ncbi:hypothetical protein TrCOL_g2769 [Triparma columacea]|uniref:Uncharacterized protein n=1 Tax=Triparma columacea TaxID=722753 RepID=A0A9W7GIL9_9STRA|nr:hypothetical protein TrCOL_g2769 [Triparma columacea]
MKEAQKEEGLKMENMEKTTSPQQLTSDSASAQQQRSTQNIIRLCNDSNDNKVILKGLLYGCIVMTEAGKNWNSGLDYVYWTFSFEVNKNMAVLNVKDSFANVINPAGPLPFTGPVGIFIILQNSASFIRTYYDPLLSNIFPSNTIIADVDNGRIKGLAWDANCNMCSYSSDGCQMNSYNFFGKKTGPAGMTDGCYLPTTSCTTNGGRSNCDVNMFVSMYGTDGDGKVLQSANARQSTFKLYDSDALNWIPGQ